MSARKLADEAVYGVHCGQGKSSLPDGIKGKEPSRVWHVAALLVATLIFKVFLKKASSRWENLAVCDGM